ncbi:MAG TPA: LysR substrate-binding domain-containing protein [Casimicrobiaceae bacterium]|jgi:DNA-binding transcriptional LysR family regulator|nr:LysR substrate-binding domain-containing protein [Casimicrobiaceae bacterium]
MNLKQVEAFRMVMRVGTVTGAAERLRISQPAVSRLLSQLESKTGLRLFARSKQRLHPTPEAILFHREVERSFVGLEKLERAANSIKNANTGTLRIASIPVVGLAFLPRVVAAFRRQHPDVSISLQTRSSVTVVDWVVSSNYDLGFASLTLLDIANVQSTPFATLPGVCILPPGHRLSAKATIEPIDLEGEDFLSYDPLDPNRMTIDQVFRDADVRRRILVEAPYAAVIAAMVSQGVGVAIVSPLAIMDQLPQNLVVKPFTPTVPFGFSVLYRKDIPLSIAARSFLTLMRSEIERTFGQEAMRAPVLPGPSGHSKS